MKKIFLTGILAGILMLVLSLLAGQIYNIILPGLQRQYQNPSLFRPWSDPLMSLIFIEPFVVGILLAFFWDKTKALIKNKLWWQRGLTFAFFYWFLGIPGMIMSYSTFPLSLEMVLAWTFTGFVQAAGAGLLLAKVNR